MATKNNKRKSPFFFEKAFQKITEEGLDYLEREIIDLPEDEQKKNKQDFDEYMYATGWDMANYLRKGDWDMVHYIFESAVPLTFRNHKINWNRFSSRVDVDKVLKDVLSETKKEKKNQNEQKKKDKEEAKKKREKKEKEKADKYRQERGDLKTYLKKKFDKQKKKSPYSDGDATIKSIENQARKKNDKTVLDKIKSWWKSFSKSKKASSDSYQKCRNVLIKFAYDNPQYRKELLPLIKEEGDK